MPRILRQSCTLRAQRRNLRSRGWTLSNHRLTALVIFTWSYSCHFLLWVMTIFMFYKSTLGWCIAILRVSITWLRSVMIIKSWILLSVSLSGYHSMNINPHNLRWLLSVSVTLGSSSKIYAHILVLIFADWRSQILSVKYRVMQGRTDYKICCSLLISISLSW